MRLTLLLLAAFVSWLALSGPADASRTSATGSRTTPGSPTAPERSTSGWTRWTRTITYRDDSHLTAVYVATRWR